jgi:uncharacterized cupredoxin-like copper-binding protein
MEPTLTDNGTAETALADEPSVDVSERLDQIEREVREQGDRARNVQRGFAIFAFVALLIAGVNLLVVAAKLDDNSTSSAARSAAPAQPATPPALGNRVGVSMKEFTITPDVRQAANGRVRFSVRNDGRIKHEFVVLKTDKPAGALLKGAEADETGNVGEIPNLPPGSKKTLSLKLAAGHYALICNLPGHYRAGQHADLTIR